MAVKSIQCTKYLLKVNFYFAAILLIAGGILSVTGSYSIFEFNEELYGAIDNNLRIMMAYLALAESGILGHSFLRKNYRVMIPVGLFLLMMIGSMKFTVRSTP